MGLASNPAADGRDAVIVARATDAKRKILAEIEQMLRSANTQSKVRIFAGIAALFLHHSETLDEELVHLFDEILLRQVPGVDPDTLAAASAQLGPIANAPPRLLRLLARHDVLPIAGPMLSHSPALTTAELVTLVDSLSAAHRLVIAARAAIDEQLAAELVRFGEREVMDRLANNPGARFHVADFGAMLGRATSDDRARVCTQMQVAVLRFGGAVAGRCMMIDISPGGAKLVFDAPVNVPDMFTLELTPAERAEIACHVVWRRGAMIGLRFTAPLIALWDAGGDEPTQDSA